MDYTAPIFDRLQDCWDPITPAQLTDLEAALGLAFPDDFRDFLLHFNAGDFRHYVKGSVRRQTRFVREFCVESTFGIVGDDRFGCSDVLHKVDVFSDRLPSTLVPIMDTGGHPIVMNFEPEDYGKIYYWDRVDECFDETPAIHLIADSFTEFLCLLKPDDEIDREFYDQQLRAFQAVERGGQINLVREFLADGGNVDLRNEDGLTLLMYTASKCWPKILALLLEAGADANARDPQRLTPLHYAICSCSMDSLKILIAAGADMNVLDDDCHNLVQFAKKNRSYRILYYLQSMLG